MKRHPPVTGAILVGGASRRMGRPKHAIPLADGRTMLEHVAAAMQPVCDTIVLLGDVPDTRWTCVPDGEIGRGPLAGLSALLRSGVGGPCLVCPCDMPLVTTSMFSALLGVDTRLAVLRSGERSEPFPMRLDARVLPDIDAALAGDDLSVRGLLRRAGAIEVEIPSAAFERLRNVNTPDELADVDVADT